MTKRILPFLLLGLVTGGGTLLIPYLSGLITAERTETVAVIWVVIMPGLIFGVVFGWLLWRMCVLPGDRVLSWIGASASGHFCAFLVTALVIPTIAAQLAIDGPSLAALGSVLGGLVGCTILTLPFRDCLRPNSLWYLLAVPVIAGLLPFVYPESAVPIPVVFYALWQGLYAAVLAWRLREIESVR